LEEETNKVWKTFGNFETFKEADLKRNELLNIHELVKVKRFGKGGAAFKVKYWNSPATKEAKRKQKKRKSKNDNQQIHN
tara:strand:+ start:281 stop:517 length:237 start_codon:yes stop_codon:yes gene_type:complete